MTSIAQVLMSRDGLSLEEAQREVEEIRAAVQEAIMASDDPEDVLLDMAGLEPDFLEELLDW